MRDIVKNVSDYPSLYDAAVAMCNAACNALKGLGGDTSPHAVRMLLRQIERGEFPRVSASATFQNGDAAGKSIYSSVRLVWDERPSQDAFDKALRRADDKCLIADLNRAEKNIEDRLYGWPTAARLNRHTFELLKLSPWRWNKAMTYLAKRVKEFPKEWSERNILCAIFDMDSEDLDWLADELDKFSSSKS